MPGYVISNDTLSFLQFDDKDNILKDIINYDDFRWIRGGTILQNKKFRISKPFGLEIVSNTSTDVEGETSYIKYDHYVDDNFTIDFWFKGIDMSFEVYLGGMPLVKLQTGTTNLDSEGRNKELFLNISKYGASVYYEEKWNHCAFTFNFSTGEISFFYNGKKGLAEKDEYIENLLEHYENKVPLIILFSAPVTYRKNSNHDTVYYPAKCYLDNVRISRGILWDKNFFPPGIFGYQTFVHGDNAYGVKSGSTVLLSSNWSSLSNEYKSTIIQDLDYDVLPEVSDMIAKSSDRNISTIESYQSITETPNLVIKSAGKKVETVYQNTLLDLSKFISIDKIVPDYTITNSSTIRVAITTDLLTYKTYNFNTSSWETIDKDKVVSDGILINKLPSIPKANLAELGSKIAFAYTIILDNSETDSSQMNSISIIASSDEKWVKTKQEDQSYGYLNSKVLQITFSKSGDYKVNYNNSNDSSI